MKGRITWSSANALPEFPAQGEDQSLSVGKHLPHCSHPGARQSQQCPTHPAEQLLNWPWGLSSVPGRGTGL